MTFFEQMNTPTVNPEEAEVKLDLRGLPKEEALVKLDDTVKHCKRSSTPTLLVIFDAAKAGGGETLFQPVARYFKFEKFNGYVSYALPVMTEERAGLFVAFKNKVLA